MTYATDRVLNVALAPSLAKAVLLQEQLIAMCETYNQKLLCDVSHALLFTCIVDTAKKIQSLMHTQSFAAPNDFIREAQALAEERRDVLQLEALERAERRRADAEMFRQLQLSDENLELV